MAENIFISATSKSGKYEELIPQVTALIGNETNLIANMANVAAALNEVFQNLWTGFYLVENNHLVLGPFQGPIACTRIAKGKGVCGSAWQEEKTIIVPNVNEFPGHIACSNLSVSEIVVPLFRENKLIAVLDIDSTEENHFDTTDKKYLIQICQLLIKQ